MLIKKITENRIKIAEKEHFGSLVVSYKGEVLSWEKEEKLIESYDLSLLGEDWEVLVVAKTKKLKGITDEAQEKLKKENILFVFDDLQTAINCYNLMIQHNKKVFGFFVL